MVDPLLLCNAGSSGLRIHRVDSTGRIAAVRQFEGPQSDVVARFSSLLNTLSRKSVVLHRIVHAGPVTESVQGIDADLLARLHHWSSLAPVHNQLALALIEQVAEQWPDCEQFAVFDSGLFSELPQVASRYPLPTEVSPDWPVRRYGFHGLAHRSQWRKLQSKGGFSRVISLQLGGGTSAAAWRDNQVIDTTMGFTPLEGLPMGGRCGSIDPGILLHLLENEAYSAGKLRELLNYRSGLTALSGGLADMRELLASEEQPAQFAVEYYCYQIRKAIGAFIAVLGGVDAITIGGGIGENQAAIRRQIFQGMEYLGFTLDETANGNAVGMASIHASGSGASIWVTPVDEADEMTRQYTAFTTT